MKGNDNFSGQSVCGQRVENIETLASLGSREGPRRMLLASRADEQFLFNSCL